MITLTRSPIRDRYIWTNHLGTMDSMSKSEAIATGVWKLNISKVEIQKAIDLMVKLRYDIVMFSRGTIRSYRRADELL